jgi:hypothetical protein
LTNLTRWDYLFPAMKTSLLLVLCALLLSACASGPAHDYYNPVVADPPKFKGPLSIELVNDLDATQKKYVSDGYTVIGTSVYQGEQPKTAELEAQAGRVHANKVIYNFAPAGMGNMQMHVHMFSGGMSEANNVSIIYLGK